jgi:hypothetical protein
MAVALPQSDPQDDPVSALTRGQSLDDLSAQAIGMLAVARVVVGRQ